MHLIRVCVVVCALAFGGCEQPRLRQEQPAAQPPQNRPAFQLIEANFGRPASVVFRMNTATGETWWLVTEPYRWVGVEDELQRAGKYNPQTKKFDFGVQLPDGRDLNELSKEELVRYLAAAIRNGQTQNPKDPLGLLEPPAKPEQP